MRDDTALTKIVNQSGFPLQLGIDRMVTNRSEQIGWQVLYREHGWQSQDGQSGFADLVLEDKFKTSVMVLECKRVQDSDWVFLVESNDKNETLNARSWVNNTECHGKKHSGYYDFKSYPLSNQSMYCIIAGQDPKARPLLERIAAETCSAAEAIAIEEFNPMTERNYGFRTYIPVIVTTARLTITTINPSQISLDRGEASGLSHKDVPFIRFRKQLSSKFSVEPKNLSWSFADLASAREKMVFVVNSQHLADFLTNWDLLSNSFSELI